MRMNLYLAIPALAISAAANNSPSPATQSENVIRAVARAATPKSTQHFARREWRVRSIAPAGDTVEDYTRHNRYYHRRSDSYITMLHQNNKYYQRRYQIGLGGKQVNIEEKEIDFVMGSGNHVRTYLNRSSRGVLVELPVAWYAENGGYWAMNPGYDRPDGPGFRRKVSYDCMACHNAYPEIPSGNEQPGAEPVFSGPLPEGIDCQRCHGPGSRHIQSPQRGNIVNPARLGADRQMEVCMQCHLETTSFRLPNSIKRFERGPFSYRPGEPLGNFKLFFDHAAGSGREDKFEIVSSAYRLRKSVCFLRSNGALRCTTCHDPHDILHGEKAVAHYNGVCRQCHGRGLTDYQPPENTPAGDCVSCHMPKRRTEDVVHAVMTDHYIQPRRPARDLLAQIDEQPDTDAGGYHGEVVPYYPSPLPRTGENDVYIAIAQVSQKSNLAPGIGQLTVAILKERPRRAEYYLALADALYNNGQLGKAIPFYEECIRLKPDFLAGLRKLGAAWNKMGQHASAVEVLKRATDLFPEDVASWNELGVAYQQSGQRAEAIAALQKAVALDPDLAEAHNSLNGFGWTVEIPAVPNRLSSRQFEPNRITRRRTTI